MTDDAFKNEIKRGENLYLGHKYSDYSMFGMFGNDQEYWLGF